jgi:hypothetical protein
MYFLARARGLEKGMSERAAVRKQRVDSVRQLQKEKSHDFMS